MDVYIKPAKGFRSELYYTQAEPNAKENECIIRKESTSNYVSMFLLLALIISYIVTELPILGPTMPWCSRKKNYMKQFLSTGPCIIHFKSILKYTHLKLPLQRVGEMTERLKLTILNKIN